MEILNKNQRNRAKWRLVILGVLLLGLLCASVYATHRQYAHQGLGDLSDCELETQTLIGQKQALKNKIRALEKEKADLEKSPDEELKICEDRLKLKEDEISLLENRLASCESSLASLSRTGSD